MKIKKKSRSKVVVVVNAAEKENGFAKTLDEIAVLAGPTLIWAGVENKWEVVAITFFWFILCKAWAARIRRNAK